MFAFATTSNSNTIIVYETLLRTLTLSLPNHHLQCVRTLHRRKKTKPFHHFHLLSRQANHKNLRLLHRSTKLVFLERTSPTCQAPPLLTIHNHSIWYNRPANTYNPPASAALKTSASFTNSISFLFQYSHPLHISKTALRPFYFPPACKAFYFKRCIANI